MFKKQYEVSNKQMEFQQKANREVPRQLTKYNLNFI